MVFFLESDPNPAPARARDAAVSPGESAFLPLIRTMPELVCYCFRVDKPTVVSAIEHGCATVDDLSALLRVGMGCGGCRPDLEDLLRFHANEPPTITFSEIQPKKVG
jgi:bacterioferritin-associated ferredoxin